MGWGTTVRHALGRFEIPAAEAYRRAFIDLDHLARQLTSMLQPGRILEVGCGDGSLAQRLTTVWPASTYLGVDPAATAGRLYRGRRDGVEFRSQTLDQIGDVEPFDLVVIGDVLHHIPPSLREGILRRAGGLVAPGGVLVIKEWARDRPFFGRLAYWADRYVTGDRDVDFMTEAELDQLLSASLPEFGQQTASRVRPWRENILIVLARSAAAS